MFVKCKGHSFVLMLHYHLLSEQNCKLVCLQVSIKYKGHTYAGSISLVPDEADFVISSGGRGRRRHAAHSEYAGGKQELQAKLALLFARCCRMHADMHAEHSGYVNSAHRLQSYLCHHWSTRCCTTYNSSVQQLLLSDMQQYLVLISHYCTALLPTLPTNHLGTVCWLCSEKSAAVCLCMCHQRGVSRYAAERGNTSHLKLIRNNACHRWVVSAPIATHTARVWFAPDRQRTCTAPGHKPLLLF